MEALSPSTSRLVDHGNARALLTYFDVGPRGGLVPAAPPLPPRRPAQVQLPSSATAFAASTSASVSTSASAAPSAPSSRRGSFNGPLAQSASSLLGGGASRRALSQLSDSRITASRISERIVPLSRHSPRVCDSLGLEKLSEDALIQRLVGIAAVAAGAAAKLPQRDHDPEAHENARPPPPAVTLDLRHQELVTYLRRAMTAGRSIPSFATLQAEQQLHPQQAEFDWLRLTRGLDRALSASEVNEPHWRTPFVTPANSLLHSESAVDGALAQQWASLAQAEVEPGVVSYAQLDLDSPDGAVATRVEVFRVCVRAALLTARREKAFHEQVLLLARAFSTPRHRLDEPRTLYPFLKVWDDSPRERAAGRKSELKGQLDSLDRHPYYSPAAFADRQQPNSKQAYFAWLKPAALSLHAQLLAVSTELYNLRKRDKQRKRLVKLSSCLPCCAPAQPDYTDEDEPPSSSSDADADQGEADPAADGFAYESPRFEDLKKPPPLALVAAKFGTRPEALQKAKDERAAARTARREVRNARNLARRKKRKAGLDVSEDERELSGNDSPPSSDESWLRTPAEEAARHEWYKGQKNLRGLHEAYNAQVQRKADAAAILQDIGLPDLGPSAQRLPPRPIQNLNRAYAVLLHDLLALQPDLAHAPPEHEVPLAKGAHAPVGLNPDFHPAFMSPPSTDSSPHPRQLVHSTTARLNPLFNPTLSRGALSLLAAFATLHNIEPVFRVLCLLRLLSRNLQRTWAYFTACRKALDELERLRESPAWTTHDRLSFLDCAERLARWSALCCAKAPILFALHVNFRSKEAARERLRAHRAAAAATKQRKSSMPPPPPPPTKGSDEAASSPAAAPASSSEAIEEEPDEDPEPPLFPPSHNTHAEAFRGALELLHCSWLALAKMAHPPPPLVVDSHPPLAPVAPSTPTRNPALDRLETWLAPLITDAFRAMYVDLSWNAGRLASPPSSSPTAPASASVALGPASASRSSFSPPTPGLSVASRDEEKGPAAAAAAVEVVLEPAWPPAGTSSPPLLNDLHLTLMLHALAEEGACAARVGSLFFADEGVLLGSGYFECATQALMSCFWPAAEAFLTQGRIPRILAMRRSASSMLALQQPDDEKLQRKGVAAEIAQVFSLYRALAWLQHTIHPVDASTAHVGSPQLPIRLLGELAYLRRWFVGLVDGFLESLLDGVDDDVLALEQAVAEGRPAPLDNLLAITARTEYYVAMLVDKPCTPTHWRNLINALAKLVKTFVEARLLASTADTNTTAAAEAGIVEELHIRYYLNTIYQSLYPPLSALSEREREKHAKAASAGGVKVAHKFGYDPVLPLVTGLTVRKLNDLRAANAHVDALCTGLLHTPALEQRGPHVHMLQNLLVQSLAFMAEGLTSIVLPNTIFHLLSFVGNPAADRWPAAKVERCFSEALGFLYGHVQALRAHKLHIDLLRELGLFLMLEALDLLALEMRNESRYAVGGVVYVKHRPPESTLLRDQLVRLTEAIKLLRSFVIDVCLVPTEWFSRPPPPVVSPTGVFSISLAQELGLGPFAPSSLAQDPHMSSPTTKPKRESQLAAPTDGSSTPIPPTGSNTPVGGSGSATPALDQPEPSPPPPALPPNYKYTPQPVWSAAPWLLCEAWKVEKLLSVCLAPTAVLAGLYETHVDRRGTPSERAAAVEKERAAQASAANEDEDDAQAFPSFGSRMAMPPRTPGQPSLLSIPGGGGGLFSPSPSFTVADTTQPPPPLATLTIDVTAPSQGGSGASTPRSVQVSGISPSPSFVTPSPVTPSSSPPPPAFTGPPHPFAVLGLSRWHVWRMMSVRATIADDSGAREWLSRTKKPERPKEVEPPSRLAKLFGKTAAKVDQTQVEE